MQKLLLFPFAPPVGVFPAPNIKIKAPSIPHVNPIVLWAISFFSYFVVLSGFIYDIIIEPPSVGSATDASGTVKPVAFLQNRINGQFIIEGLSAGFMFVIGGVGLVILDKVLHIFQNINFVTVYY